MFSVLSGGEDDQLTLDNCPSSSLDAATTYNTDPSHDSTIDNHDSTPPVPSAITAPPPNHTDRDARTTRDSPPIRSTSTSPSPRHTDRDARTPRERMAECRVSPGKTHVLIGDSVFGQIRPELMYPHKAQQNISISGLTVDDLLHWLQNVLKCRDVQLLVVHVGVSTCWVNTVTSMWRALLKLLKSVFPNAVVQLSSLIPPQGEHPLRKTVAASNAALVKACHSEQVMLADHTDTFNTNSGAPRKALYRDALHSSPKGTVRLACNVKYMYVGQPRPPLRPQERPSHPSPSASGPASSCTPIAPVTGGVGWGGGVCSGDTCVTQACSVCPAVCFNGSLFLYTPDWCVLVAWMRVCVCARVRSIVHANNL